MAWSTRSTFGQAVMRSMIPPPGRTNGSVSWGAPWSPARTMSMREMMVPKVIGGQAHEGEDAIRCKSQDATEAIDDSLTAFMVEADPMFDATFEPGQFDLRQHGAGARPAFGSALIKGPPLSGNSRVSRSREPRLRGSGLTERLRS